MKTCKFIIFLGFVFICNNIIDLNAQRINLHKNNDNISLDSSVSIPLTDMLNEEYKGYKGGLFGNGSNLHPEPHWQDGKDISNTITPLDTFGNIDNQSGSIVLLSVGMSNATQEFSVFKTIADKDSEKNSFLKIIDGAQGGQTASVIQDPTANFWIVINQRLRQAKCSNKQVQVVWLKEADAGPKNDFPVHAQTLYAELKKICNIIVNKFPNLKICYFSSRTYGGYATTTLNPEPMAYETGYSIQWLIKSQIEGDTVISYQGNKRRAPWISWGPYLWANGTTPRSDGLIWEKNDFVTNDYTHPSDKGRLKVANLLLNFFKTDETSKSWFLNQTSIEEEIPDKLNIYPNPVKEVLFIDNAGNQINSRINIIDIFGNKIYEGLLTDSSKNIDLSSFPVGIYFLKIGMSISLIIKE